MSSSSFVLDYALLSRTRTTTRTNKTEAHTTCSVDLAPPAPRPIPALVPEAQGSDGRLELLVYGKDKEPIQRVALQTTAGQQENTIDLETEAQGGGATLVLKILGKYEARLKVVAD